MRCSPIEIGPRPLKGSENAFLRLLLAKFPGKDAGKSKVAGSSCSVITTMEMNMIFSVAILRECFAVRKTGGIIRGKEGIGLFRSKRTPAM